MELDRHGQEVLGREECLRLMQSKATGRVGITMSALPAILPVHFALLDGDVVFPTAAGSKLTAAAQRAVVAFEVDDVSTADHSGWSVLVVGQASEISDADELAHAQRLPLAPWAADTRHYIRIRSEIVSGRRIGEWPGSPIASPAGPTAPLNA